MKRLLLLSLALLVGMVAFAKEDKGEEKKHLTVEQLMNLFSRASGSDVVNDKLLLS